MIVSELFRGDSGWIGWIQHDMYGEALRVIVSSAEETFRQAEVVLGIRTEIGLRLPVNGFDHRTLQYFHDRIAAQFRFNYCTSGDLFVFFKLSELNEQQRVQLSWIEFLQAEMPRLLKIYSSLARNILVAALYPNPQPEGLAAEEYIYNLIRETYPHLGRPG